MKSITGNVTCCSTAGEPETLICFHYSVYKLTRSVILMVWGSEFWKLLQFYWFLFHSASQFCGDQVDALTSWRRCTTKEKRLYSCKLYSTCSTFCAEISPVMSWDEHTQLVLLFRIFFSFPFFAMVYLGSFLTWCVLASCRLTSCCCPVQTPTVCAM